MGASEGTMPLGDTIEEARRKTISALKGKPLADNFDRLLVALGDESWRVRKEAVEVLLTARLGQSEINQLIQLLRDEDNAGLRNSTAEVLAGLGCQVVPYLLAYREDPDHDLRKLVVDTLGVVGGDEAIAGLTASLHDPDMNVAAAAAEGLGAVGTAAVVPELLRTLELNAGDFLNFNILAALANIGVPGPLPPVIALLAGNAMLRRAVLDCLGQIGGDPAAAEIVLEALASPMPSVFRSAVIALERILRNLAPAAQQQVIERLKPLLDSGAFDACISGVRCDDNKLNKALLVLFERLADPRTAPALIVLLADERFATEAEQALRAIGAAAVTTALAVFPDVDERTRAAICGFVSSAPPDGRTAATITSGMKDASPLVRRAAAAAAARICDRTNLTMEIAELLEDRDSSVREAALHALAQCVSGSEQLIAPLAESLSRSDDPARRRDAATLFAALAAEERIGVLLKDEDPTVREAAVKAIGSFQLHDSCTYLSMALVDEDPDVRIAAAEALGVTVSNCASIRSLRLALRDQDSWVQASALRSLARLASEQILEDVKDLWQRGDEVAQLACLEVLGRIAAPEGLRMVAENLGMRSGEVLRGCIQLLARHDFTLLEPWFSHIISHRSWDIRLEAVRAAGNLPQPERTAILEAALQREEHELVKRELQSVLAYDSTPCT